MLYTITNDNGRIAHLKLVPGQLAADVGCTVDIAAVDECSHGHQQRRIIMRHIACIKALRVLFGNKGGREITGLEARVLHQRRLERNV